MQVIKAWTDNWGPEKIEVKELIWCQVKREGYKNAEEVVFRLDLFTCTKHQAQAFFKRVSQHCLDTRNTPEEIHYQFKAVLKEAIKNGAELVTEFFVKWFWLEVLDTKIMLSHDVAFNTVLVKKRRFYTENNKFESHQTLPLGTFFRKRWSKAKHTHAKQQKQAYKCMGNLLLKEK